MHHPHSMHAFGLVLEWSLPPSLLLKFNCHFPWSVNWVLLKSEIILIHGGKWKIFTIFTKIRHTIEGCFIMLYVLHDWNYSTYLSDWENLSLGVAGIIMEKREDWHESGDQTGERERDRGIEGRQAPLFTLSWKFQKWRVLVVHFKSQCGIGICQRQQCLEW